ncbi:helix-turn-helix transcriptional regulator [Marinobacter mobilis]|uniref:helix-turn-helix transcriptional regulator n=1 Tax=Marinobacter mobilis TaxID=488533 RepID=UPI0035C7888F
MTTDYEFTLKFAIPEAIAPEQLEERLFEAGCDDAILGLGQPGRLALNFTREASSAETALVSALTDVRKAIPEARLVEAGPDLVGISDIARLLDFSRQNMRKLIQTHLANFPLPLHEGKSAIWHLADVLEWFIQRKDRPVENSLVQVAKASMEVNFARESSRVDPKLQERVRPVLAKLS